MKKCSECGDFHEEDWEIEEPYFINDVCFFCRIEIKDELKKMNKRKPGGGRKPEYNESTTTIAFRVPISHKERITTIVKEYLKKLKK